MDQNGDTAATRV